MDSLRSSPVMPAGSIRLLDRLAFLGGTFVGEWVGFPAEYAQAELVVVYDAVEALGALVGVGLETTYDTDSVVQTISPSMVNSPGVVVQQAGSNLGPRIRCVVGATSVPLKAIISAWLTPKRS